MVCAEDEQSDVTEVFYGENCSEEFLKYLDGLVMVEEDEERDVIVVFHNFKGYDGMFILQQLFKEHRSVTDQINVGTKVLSLRTGYIKIIDSFCFLPFPLASFPATFGLTELRKGFFPHLFNTLNNQQYEGAMPPRDTYDPKGMNSKKKDEFDKWYDEQLENGYI